MNWIRKNGESIKIIGSLVGIIATIGGITFYMTTVFSAVASMESDFVQINATLDKSIQHYDDVLQHMQSEVASHEQNTKVDIRDYHSLTFREYDRLNNKLNKHYHNEDNVFFNGN